jgi:hypothetical protein
MKKTSQEIDYSQAIVTMRTVLSLNNADARGCDTKDPVSVEAIDYTNIEKPLIKHRT